MRVAVIKGGVGAEREVSLVTGAAVADALRGEGFAVEEVDARPASLLDDLVAAAPDVVFNALHGDWGEGGEVQTLLDGRGYAYTHSGAAASRLAMDKDATKRALAAHGVGVAHGETVARGVVAEGGAMAVPYVVKPNGSGSSASVYLVHEETPELLARIGADAGLGERPVVERYVPGRELTVAVMDGHAMGVTEIVPRGWYSYAEKYGEDAARHVLPAEIPDAVRATCLAWAETAHRVLGCAGLTRTDFRWDAETLTEDNGSQTDAANGLVTLELNTQPGMTPTSLAPEQAAWVGLSFGELCRWIVEDAACRRLTNTFGDKLGERATEPGQPG